MQLQNKWLAVNFFISGCLLLFLFSCNKKTETRPNIEPINNADSSLNKSYNIQLNGQNIFPVGFFGIGWREPYNDKITCLETISNAGFNAIHFDDIGTNNFAGILDRSAQLGNINVLVGLGNEATQSETNTYIVNAVNAFKNKPALLGWNIGDDADDGRFSIADLINRNTLVKNNDPNHFTTMALTGYYPSRRNSVSQYAETTNIGFEIYPVTPPSDFDVTSTSYLTETYNRTLQYVNAARSKSKSMLMLPQTFSWASTGVANARYPTALELRNMCYAGLCAGVNGLIAYDFSFDLKNNQQSLWNEYISIKNDILIDHLQEYLMTAPLTRYTTGTSELFASYWQFDTDLLLIVVNTNTTTAKYANITLPNQYTSITPLFSRMPNTLVLQNGNKMQGNIEAKQVEVYELHK